MKYTIEEARKIVLSCQKQYANKLANKQFLIIYKDVELNMFAQIELVFFEKNYQHLTGIELINSEGQIIENCSLWFYKKCKNNKLSNKEIAFKNDGTTPLKLEALPALTNFTSITRIAGTSNGNRPFIYVEKYVGGTNFCLGIDIDEDSKEYVPISALKEDIRNLVTQSCQVIAIFERDYAVNEKYRKIKHVAKGINLLNISFPTSVSSMICLDDYIPK